MGMIEFSGNGKPYTGYLAPSATGKGPGVIVIQEWWGLVGHIKDVADRFAAEGFTALAPDFYHGVQTTEPDEAGSMLMALNIADAERVIQGAVDALLAQDSVEGEKVGVVGFCMGGQLSMYAATINKKIGACVNFYGVHPNVHPIFRDLEAPMLGFFGNDDHITTPDVVNAIDVELNDLGKAHEFHRMEGVGHAFFNSDRPEVYNADAAEKAWTRMLEFFREHL